MNEFARKWGALGAPILPVYPVHGMQVAIGADRGADSGEERRFAELREQSKTLQLVLHGILHFRKAELDAGGLRKCDRARTARLPR